MRAFPLFSVLAAALAGGCGPAEPDRGANRAAAPPPVAGVPAAPPAETPAAAVDPEPLPPATAKTIPEAMLGTYDASIEACGTASDGRLTVSPTELRFHESIGVVHRVSAAGAGAVRVEADYQGEGERWRGTRELRLADRGASLTVSGDGTSFTRIRCPAEAR